MEVFGAATLLPLLAVIEKPEKLDNRLYLTVTEIMSHLGLSSTSIATLLMLIVFLLWLKAVFTYLAMRTLGFSVVEMSNHMRLELIRSLLKAQWRYFSTLPLGNITNALGTEANRAGKTYLNLCQMLSSVFLVGVYLIALAFISWKITLASLVLSIFVMVLFYQFVKMVRTSGEEQTVHMSDLSALITDSIASIKVIKSMGREKHYAKLLKVEIDQLKHAKQKWVVGRQTIQSFREPIIVSLLALGIYMTKSYGGASLTDMSMASMITFAFMFLRIVQKITGLQGLYQVLIIDESAYWSLLNAAETAKEHEEKWQGTSKPVLNSRLRFENVTFQHVKEGVPVKVLNNVTFDIPAHKLNAVIGGSGSGKTTLLDLIAGFYTPQSGTIFLDDTALGDVDIKAWRRSIGYVPQDHLLLHDTIYNNITMGQDNLNERDVEDALRQAGALPFVETLPGGIHETVGEKGLLFSGGQRQRISIARALVNKPQLLILDEPTSALDNDTEAAFFETIRTLADHMSVLIISHTPEIKKYADYVYVLSNGDVEISLEHVSRNV